MGLNEDAGLCAIRKDRRVFFNQCHLLVTDPFDPVLRKGVINQLLVVIVDALPQALQVLVPREPDACGIQIKTGKQVGRRRDALVFHG